MPRSALFDVFRSRRMAMVFLLGFSSGVPLMLTGQTLQVWMSDAHVDLKSIATFSLVGTPYTFKWIWAWMLDRYRVQFLGRRRGWILVFQLVLAVALFAMSAIDPLANMAEFATIAVVVAAASASQDIVIDAYNADLLQPAERAAGSAAYVMGYRVAMLVASTVALLLADHIPWSAVYTVMAAVMAACVIVTFFAEEPPESDRPPQSVDEAIYLPFVEFVRRLGWRSALLLLAFAATYKFGEQFAQVLSQTFFRNVIGFSKTEMALIQKAVGFSAWAVGGVAGGVLVARYGVRKMLVVFGILQASTHLAYLWIAYAGKDLVVYGVGIFVENLSFAMATAAFTAALMGVTARGVSAMQLAVLTALTSVGQRVFGTFAADVVEAVGWTGFFITTIAMGIPGIILAWFATAPPPPASQSEEKHPT